MNRILRLLETEIYRFVGRSTSSEETAGAFSAIIITKMIRTGVCRVKHAARLSRFANEVKQKPGDPNAAACGISSGEVIYPAWGTSSSIVRCPLGRAVIQAGLMESTAEPGRCWSAGIPTRWKRKSSNGSRLKGYQPTYFLSAGKTCSTDSFRGNPSVFPPQSLAEMRSSKRW